MELGGIGRSWSDGVIEVGLAELGGVNGFGRSQSASVGMGRNRSELVGLSRAESGGIVRS